ncbi:FixH family protein [Rubellimicrobium roseum]|uniref:FixH family protein n=1 Tax=Rubellimicrobium roseum TaxID=687525 RepID=A0A5C4N835_9RHOB|nr:FixH family protein [Rubellimicrobium roseum]TNC64497.1 FixH family protein [Rubellimicrobium roseum]
MTNPFSGPITGPKAFAIFSSFFVVIISVNMVLAYQAVHTFPGLEVKNSYVASQSFDAERRAQEALGWTARAAIEGDELALTITGPDGAPVRGATLSAMLGRATVRTDDQTPALAFDGAAWRAPVTVGPGHWELRIEAVAADGTPFRQRLDLMVE